MATTETVVPRSTDPSTAPGKSRGVVRASIGVGFAGLGVVAVVSLSWPRFHDAPIMEYVAWLNGKGYRPYRDVFDMNFPGSYLVQIVGDRTLGASDLSFRIFDLLVFGLGCVAIYRLMRRVSWPAAPVAVLLVGTQYLAFGTAGSSLQRDWTMALLGVAGAATLLQPNLSTRWLLTGGLAMGFAATVKPQAMLLLAAVPFIILINTFVTGPPSDETTQHPRLVRRGWLALRTGVARSFPVAAGALVAVGLVLLWVVVSGGWADFRWMVTKYAPLYAKLKNDGTEISTTAGSMVWSFRKAIQRPEILPFFLSFAVLASRRRPSSELRTLLTLGVLLAVGFVHAVVSVKNWEYHYWPWTIAGLCLAAVAFGDVYEGRWESWSGRFWDVASPLVSVAFALGAVWGLSGSRPADLRLLANLLPVGALAAADLVRTVRRSTTSTVTPNVARAGVVAILCLPMLVDSGLSAKVAAAGSNPPTYSQVPEVAPTEATTEAIAAVLRRELKGSDKVQVLGTGGAGLEALLEAEAQPATPYIYDFHFFHDTDTTVIRQLRRRLIDEWSAAPPKLVVEYDASWGRRETYTDIEQFPELAELLDGYSVIFSDDSARVLRRNSP